VREREAERRRAADHLTLGVVLRAVARALELVLSLVPGDDATQVRAHRVQTKVSERPILLDDQVSGVTLQALRERVVARQVRLEPRRLLDVVTVRILRGLTGTTATGAVVRISNTQSVTCSRSRRRVIYHYGRGASSCTKRGANLDHHRWVGRVTDPSSHPPSVCLRDRSSPTLTSGARRSRRSRR